MRAQADKAVESRLHGAKRILDVGGAGSVSRHATHVIDRLPYEWWQAWPQKGTTAIPRENYVVHDVCDSRPFPFPDKYFDFVVSSHTLEDLRDPIRVCEEMSRVGKAGYLETPSPLLELSWGRDKAPWAGYCHHRWLVSVEKDALVFRLKPHLIHSSPRFHFSARFGKKLEKLDRAYTCYFWSDRIACREEIDFLYSRETIEDYIESIIRSEIGDNISMLKHRVKNHLWRFGVSVVDRWGVRSALRPLAAKLRNKFWLV
jgi:SAM-dependent methyltransferase